MVKQGFIVISVFHLNEWTLKYYMHYRRSKVCAYSISFLLFSFSFFYFPYCLFFFFFFFVPDYISYPSWSFTFTFYFPVFFVILVLFSSSYWCIIFFLFIFVNFFILSFFVINFLCFSFVVWLPHFLSFVPYCTFRFRLHLLTWASQVKRFVECNNTQWTLQC